MGGACYSLMREFIGNNNNKFLIKTLRQMVTFLFFFFVLVLLRLMYARVLMCCCLFLRYETVGFFFPLIFIFVRVLCFVFVSDFEYFFSDFGCISFVFLLSTLTLFFS